MSRRPPVPWRLVRALTVSAGAIGGGMAAGLGAMDTVVVLSGLIVLVESVYRTLPASVGDRRRRRAPD